MRTVRAAFVALCVLFAVTAGALAPAAGVGGGPEQATTTTTTANERAGLGIRLVEVPTDRLDDPRANQYIVDHIDSGVTVRRRVEVHNDSDAPIRARFYAGGARVTDGAFVPDDSGGDIPAWSSVSPETLDLVPDQKASVVASIAVPRSASAGERYGAVWAEVRGETDEASGISTVNRVGIRVYLSVGGSDEPPTRFSLPTFTPTRDADGRPGVDIEACNDGGRAIDLSGSLSLSDGPGGVAAGPFASEGPAVTLAPAQCGKASIRLAPEMPLGPWKATATLRSGTFEESATADITFPEAAGASAPPVAASPREVTGTTEGRLWLLVALLLLLLVLGVLLRWLWHRRGRLPAEAEADAGAEAEAEAEAERPAAVLESLRR